MKVVISACLWLLISVVCPAAEIVAWKVPLEAYLYGGLKSEGVVRLEKPPEPSPFFGAADELWDLGGVPTANRDDGFSEGKRLATHPPAEWAVWNASTRRLVAKGDLNSMWQLHEDFWVEHVWWNYRYTLDVFEMKADGTPPDEKSILIAQLSWVSRFGESEAFSSARGQQIRVKAKGTPADELFSVDLSLSAVCSIPDHPEIEIETSLYFDPGKRMWFARNGDGKNGIDLAITAQIVLPDGTPFDERVMIQRGVIRQPIKPSPRGFRRHQGKGGEWLAICRTDMEWVRQFAGEEINNPFAEENPRSANPPMEPLKIDKLGVPQELIGWFGNSVWDLRNAMIRNGVMAADSPSLAGYDPWLENLFLYSEDPEELKRMEQLIVLRGPDVGAVNHVALWWGAGTQTTRLVSRSGHVARLDRSLNGKKPIHSLKVEPTVSDDGRLIDLYLEYRDGPSEEPQRSGHGRLTVDSGVQVEVMSHEVSGEAQPPLVVMAEGVGPTGEAEQPSLED